MTIRLTNTLSGCKEDFVPLDPQRVTMYVCGPTVYNYIHIGNARPIVVFDLLYRLLKSRFRTVVYARNVTDIDDKIIAAAAERNTDVAGLAAHYTNAFHEDIAPLNVLPPDVEPRATEHLEPMIAMARCLLDSGHAYAAEGHVLFHVPTMADYGRLSRRKMEDLIAGARVEVAPYKKHPSDFVLWKPSEDEQPGWESPWGRGRPGWHLECSVMAETHLGETIDIHGGGQDLVFPHHENEIAQSTCSHRGRPFARYWVHNGYITVQGEKMSKSTGNFFMLREVLAQFPGECVRFALLAAHYRKPLDWSPDALRRAYKSLEKWYRLLLDVPASDAGAEADPAFTAALCDDLNTPQAIAELHRLVQDLAQAPTAERKRRASALRASAAMMGLLQEDAQVWLRWKSAAVDTLVDAEIETLVAERTRARMEKDYAAADGIRRRLSDAGIVLEDAAGDTGGTRWLRQHP